MAQVPDLCSAPAIEVETALVRALRRRGRARPEDLVVDIAQDLDLTARRDGAPGSPLAAVGPDRPIPTHRSQLTVALLMAALPHVIDRAVSHDDRIHQLPDQILVHLPTLLDGRILTTAPAIGHRRCGLLPVGQDLSVGLLPFSSWPVVPVQAHGLRTIAERVTLSTGTTAIAVDPTVLPAADLIGVAVGPEGLALAGVEVDEAASSMMRRALGRLREPQASWPATDRILHVLSRDDRLGRAPVAPLSDLLAACVHRERGRLASADTDTLRTDVPRLDHR